MAPFWRVATSERDLDLYDASMYARPSGEAELIDIDYLELRDMDFLEMNGPSPAQTAKKMAIKKVGNDDVCIE